MPAAPLIVDGPRHFTLQGPINDQGERGVMVAGYDLLRLFRERRGIAAQETPGGGERTPTSCRVSVSFEA